MPSVSKSARITSSTSNGFVSIDLDRLHISDWWWEPNLCFSFMISSTRLSIRHSIAPLLVKISGLNTLVWMPSRLKNEPSLNNYCNSSLMIPSTMMWTSIESSVILGGFGFTVLMDSTGQLMVISPDVLSISYMNTDPSTGWIDSSCVDLELT